MKFVLSNVFCIILAIICSPVFLIQHHKEMHSYKKEAEKFAQEVKEKTLDKKYENLCNNYF